MRKTTFLALAATLTLAGMGAKAADDTGSFYVSPLLQYDFLSHKREADNDTAWQVGLGYNIAPMFSAEVNYSRGTFSANDHNSIKLESFGADVLFKLLPNSDVHPYLLAGGGQMNDKKINFNRNNTFDAEAGLGLLIGLGDQTGSTRISFRGEGKYRREFTNTYYDANHPGDYILSAGVLVSFGNRVAPAPVAAPPPPVDSDGDGVPDDRDHCPGTPAGAKVDANGCEFDSDGDGVVDRLDQCPDTPHGTPVDAKGCPLDSDGDGVIDSLDRCPNTPKGDRVDTHGCTIKDEIKLPRVNFMTDSANLLPESQEVLDDAVATLKKYPELVIEVRGHTDSRGSKKHNKILSQKRAESVEAYLKDHGVTNTLTAKGYGEDLPIADNKTEEGRLENRRVSLKILNGGST